ncbi:MULTISPECIES: efflux RND transporter permease subunit [Paraburkholderia]|uniref:efflux RND transporter permease subunit n=1 Tax=Paraburkholderia TaxID=1822464 RepID=UPI00225469A6|nr:MULTISPECIES: efflux RND transporter permease subunit [Paraburkholderia]MCX4164226.1 efflux RND transporter permease subunit [Paraburkholderia megapolitana]MDN7159720.1 efflux RND transporter permease subunit [Paraburkholderia sp. CHISQ3]MDQ6496767.1 efflux RND transporter permease subunit [Paraburkholderia megapolitana]
MWIVKVALRRPYTFVVLALLLLIIGPLMILRTPVDIFPNIDIPVISIVWSYTGMSSEDMAHRIVSPYERALTSDVGDIEHVESQSLNGVAVIKVFFHPGADITRAMTEASTSAQSLLRVLPPGTLPPLVLTYNASTVPIMELALSSKTLPEQTLYDLGNNFIRTQLATVEGAAVPIPYGGKVRQIMVDINEQALQAKHLTPTDVVNAVNAQNLVLPGGTAKIGTFEYNVNMNGAARSVAELNAIPIRTQPDGTVTYVRDVATVRDGYAPQTNIVRHDGQRAALLEVEKSGNVSTLDIIANIKSLLPRIRAEMPSALDIQTVTDQSVFVKSAVRGVIREGLIAAGLTAVMILLFLGSWRATLIIAISIPLAMISSLIMLSLLGQTINIMTLGGLALAVGILVDDATVAIENITHHLEKGQPLLQAILDGSGEIAVPTLISTLSICIVFVPMLLLSGVARYLFTPLAEAVVFAMLASYFLSRTLVPTLAMYLLRRSRPAGEEGIQYTRSLNRFERFQKRFEAGFEGLRDRYQRVLERALVTPRRFIAGFLLVCIGSLALVPFLGRDFFPQIDSGQIRLHMRAKTGTRIEQTARLADEIENSIRAVIPASELTTIVDNIGLPTSGINLSYSSSAPIGSADADILITLNANHKPTAQYVAKLRQMLDEQFPAVTFSFLPADMVSQILNFGLPAPIDIQVVGNNLNDNRAFADTLLNKLRNVEGLVDLRIQQPDDQPAIDVDVDRTKALQARLQQQDVARSLLIALSGSSQTSPNFWLNPQNGVSYPVTTEAPQYDINSLQALANIPLASTFTPGTGGSGSNAGGVSGILGSLGTFSRATEQAVVSHYNVQPVIDIFGSVQGRDLGGVATDVTKIVDASKADLPRGVRVVIRGQVQTMQSSFDGLAMGIAFAVLLVYLLMVVNFQSWLDPLVIIAGLPGAMTGIVWMLFVTRTTLSVPALTGAMMCIGVATANSILVVNFAREQLAQGMAPLQAALAAGVGRFRPVLMTALAMVIGMVPMALGMGDGGEQNAPLGRAVIGGLMIGTVTTLIFLPVVFSLVHGWLAKRRPHGVPQSDLT